MHASRTPCSPQVTFSGRRLSAQVGDMFAVKVHHILQKRCSQLWATGSWQPMCKINQVFFWAKSSAWRQCCKPSIHLMYMKKLEGVHNFAMWQKQWYNILLYTIPYQGKPYRYENKMIGRSWSSLHARPLNYQSMMPCCLILKVWPLPMLFGLDYTNCIPR